MGTIPNTDDPNAATNLNNGSSTYIPPTRITNRGGFSGAVNQNDLNNSSNFYRDLLSGGASGSFQQAGNEASARAASNLRAQNAAANVDNLGQGAAVSSQQDTEQGIMANLADQQLQQNMQDVQLKQIGAQGIAGTIADEQNLVNLNEEKSANAYDDVSSYLDQQVVTNPDYVSGDMWKTDDIMVGKLENQFSTLGMVDDAGNPVQFDLNNPAHSAWAASEMSSMSMTPEGVAANRYFASPEFKALDPEKQDEIRELTAYSQIMSATGGFQMHFNEDDDSSYVTDADGNIIAGEKHKGEGDPDVLPGEAGFEFPDNTSVGDYFETNGVLYERTSNTDAKELSFDADIDGLWGSKADNILKKMSEYSTLNTSDPRQIALKRIGTPIAEKRVDELIDGTRPSSSINGSGDISYQLLLHDPRVTTNPAGAKSMRGSGNKRHYEYDNMPEVGGYVNLDGVIYQLTGTEKLSGAVNPTKYVLKSMKDGSIISKTADKK